MASKSVTIGQYVLAVLYLSLGALVVALAWFYSGVTTNAAIVFTLLGGLIVVLAIVHICLVPSFTRQRGDGSTSRSSL